MADMVRWFPLERIGDLEAAIGRQLDSRSRSVRRDAVAVSLGLSGLRSGEVSQLTVGDLSVPMRRLRVRTLKHGPHRDIDLDPSVVAEIQQLRGKQTLFEFAVADDQLLLPNRRGGKVRREQFAAMAARLFDSLLGSGHQLTFHSLRHTFAMRLYSETRDLFLVKQMLGHASIATTEIYARSLAKLPTSVQPRLIRGAQQPPQLKVVSASG